MRSTLALWAFPIFSLVCVVILTLRGGEVVDAPIEPNRPTARQHAAVLERSQNLTQSLERAADARRTLEQHVSLLREEVREMRAERTALSAEAELWRESYDLVARRFDELAALAGSTATEMIEDTVTTPISASFSRSDLEAVPVPAGAVIVR